MVMKTRKAKKKKSPLITKDNQVKDLYPAEFRFRDLFQGELVFWGGAIAFVGAVLLVLSFMNPIAPGVKPDDFCYSTAIYPIEFYPSLEADVKGWLASGIPSYTGFDGSDCFDRDNLPVGALRNI